MHQVLARKWRPKNFHEVIGQEHVIRALENALTQKRLHHAYLFTGTRGVGKTTIARILAKCFNCETGVTATPCGKCDACLEIDAGRFIDLIEVDAASRTKVEDTRDLLDNVQYLPAKARCKVYLIDEVHMLSGHSFNALLKTLEEPPAHVKFLLATTDPDRLPVTVLSRCLQFNLKALSAELIQKQLQYVLDQEHVSYETKALLPLALAANGSVRDALSLLDQAIAYGQGNIIITDVNALLGTVDTDKLFNLVTAIAENNADLLIHTVFELSELAVDFSSALDDLLTIFHRIALKQIIPNVDTSNWQHVEKILALSQKFSAAETQLYYQIGLIGKRDLPLAPNPRLGLEMVLLRMLAFRPAKTLPISLSDKPTNKTIAPEQVKSAVKTAQIEATAIATTVAATPIAAAATNTLPNTTANLDLLKQLNVSGPTQALLRHCAIKTIANDKVELILEANQAPLLNKKHIERLNIAFTEHFKKPITTEVTLAASAIETTATITARELEQKKADALNAINQDQKIQDILQKFDAVIIPETVTSD
ncbi:MAG: DNA polymerase III subunit gamma/tau [Gammaproteobacteria bacterium]|nr:DNA polymerase III subunit gamma/tau [Gammaproteobacteria bacterium]